ncbi:PAS domain S-box protein [Natronorubrum halophilum]|uniref:PAS domain S-box protein n=1 Tax=Natronorubrum halophilum TaxID=1702106 RepID=UPI0010C17602|nr:PAS domain S-box protein [Natronorubrum halophilum]
MTDQSSEQNDGSDESDGSESPGRGVDFPEDFSLDARQLTGLLSECAVSLLDSNGRVATWNDGIEQLTGYDANEILDAHYRVFFPQETRETQLPAQLLERARANGRVEDEGWRLRRDGSRFWVREVIVPVRDTDLDGASEFDSDRGSRDGSDGRPAELRGYARVLHDRTDEHERELELHEEQVVAESVLEAQPDIVYAFDEDGTFLEWNDRVPDVTGYTEAELAEMTPTEFIAPEHRDRIADEIAGLLEENEYVTVEADLLTKDGTQIPYEFNSARITDESGTTLGFTGVGRDISDRKARERELREEKALTESIFEAQPDLLYAYDTEGRLIHWNERFEQFTGYDADELEGMNPLDFIVPADRDTIRDAIERILTDGDRVTAEGRVLTSDGEHIPYEFNSARITDADGTVLGFTGVGRDISDRKARERELERLERLNATIRAIDETMVAAETRAEVETAITEAFAAADAYQFAAIGRVDAAVATDQQPWDPQAWAGIDSTGVDAVLSSFIGPTADAPGESVLETGSVQCYHSLRESPVDDWRAGARTHDYGSIAIVPIVASGRTFGLLVIAAEESTAFTDREREVLQEFGGTIGHAINAMAVRRLLYLDTVIELELESTTRRDVCIDLSAQAGCRLTLDHVLPLTDERFVYYVTAVGVDPAQVRAYAADEPAIEEFRRIDAVVAESQWEFIVRGPTITGLLADYGARMRSMTVDDGVSNAVVQVSPDVDVREVVDAVTTAYPDTQLLSKRTVERPVETRGDFRRQVETELTDKQRTALEAAYYGGYFEWPTRNSDASDIADRLDIARQTFHQHLRVAQEKLFAAYFEGKGERQRE